MMPGELRKSPLLSTALLYSANCIQLQQKYVFGFKANYQCESINSEILERNRILNNYTHTFLQRNMIL